MIVLPQQDGNHALDGTPMGEYLLALATDENYEKEESVKVLELSLEMAEELKDNEKKCCHDPEVCVHAVCVVCPECKSTQTIRTREPDADNVSEFECLNCECFFTAVNP